MHRKGPPFSQDSEMTRETLLKKLKAVQAASKALLWERAVAQRLRKALDMAEALL